ncbi:transcriptional regulator, TetR family [Chitinophaga jiangningensis]|uniref:Transcriptional regulator, TetR family n=1 Tax=Chitinophaga jiangningensis TaxID=1419482 RepID=A0A1M7M819_9BACT|nr:TetR/AcrR family transcriptional regulator [Chitinophaga jiangningensis]SHM86829.1 transcriptional regulator, TetR family [Chitinophaga jiangningensis]
MARLVAFNEEQAVQKAMEVFWRKGYTATSMRDLTDAMQINSSSLYNTIGDKQELFKRCLHRYTNERMEEMEVRYKSPKSPLKALELYINDAVHIITTDPNSCLCLKATFEIEGDVPEIQAVINSYDHYRHRLLTHLLKSAQDLGEIPDDEKPEVIADYLGSIFVGWYNSLVLHKDKSKIVRMADLVKRQLKR